MLAALVASSLGACGGDQAKPGSEGTTYRNARYGYAVAIPRGWAREPRPLATIYDPREVLAVATFRPVAKRSGCDQFPTAALRQMPRDGVLVELQERSGSPTPEFVPRPRHFTAAMGAAELELLDCLPKPARFRPRWIWFRDGRRIFHALIAVGRSAPASRRREAYAILDSLRFDPRVRARWAPSG